MEVKWIEYNSKKVLLVDYSGIPLERDMLSLLAKVPPLIKDLEETNIRSLTDITGCFITPGFLDASKNFEKEFLSAFKVKRAIVGVVGPKVFLLRGYNLFTKNKLVPFDNRNDALDYLTNM